MVLFDSVPPEVNRISSGSAPISAATCFRAFVIAFFAFLQIDELMMDYHIVCQNMVTSP